MKLEIKRKFHRCLRVCSWLLLQMCGGKTTLFRTSSWQREKETKSQSQVNYSFSIFINCFPYICSNCRRCHGSEEDRRRDQGLEHNPGQLSLPQVRLMIWLILLCILNIFTPGLHLNRTRPRSCSTRPEEVSACHQLAWMEAMIETKGTITSHCRK